MRAETYYDDKGRVRNLSCASESDRALTLLRHAGPRSKGKLGALRIADYVLWRSERQTKRGLVSASISNQAASLQKWVCSRIGERPISEITSDNCLALQTFWRSNLSESTVDCLRRYLEDLFSMAMERGAIFANPASKAFRKEKRPQGWTPARAPNDELVDQLWGSKKLLHRAVLALILDTRPSASELAALCWEDIDLDGGTVTYRFYVDGSAIVEQARPDCVRTLNLGEDAVRLLEEWRDRKEKPLSPLVFCQKDGSRSTPARFDYIARRLQFDAEVPHDPERVRRKRKPDVVPRNAAFARYLAPYSLEELGNVAVLRWKISGIDDLELQRRVGVANSRGLMRFEALFNGLDLDGDAFDALDGLLGK